MPKEVKSEEELLQISKRASECRVRETKDGKVKLKLRTPKCLYTFVTQKEKAEEVLKKMSVQVKRI